MKILTPLLLLATALTLRAATPVEWFPLDEGATNLAATTVYSEITGSTNNGIFDGTDPWLPVWESTNLPPIPAPANAVAVYFDATAGTSVAGKPSIDTTFPGVLGTQARTVTAWIKSELSQPNQQGAHFINWGGGAGGSISAGRYSIKLQPDTAGADAGKLRLEISGGGIEGTHDLRDAKWHHIAVVSTNNSPLGHAQLYVDGNLETLTTTSGTTLIINTVDTTTNTTYGTDLLRIGNAGWDTTRGFNGTIADVRIYTNALAQSDILEIIYGAGSPPSLTQQPASQTPELGDTVATAAFTAAVSGSPTLYYQWKHAGTNLVGQTNLSLVVGPELTAANLGTYQVVVSNKWGTVTSSNAILAWGTAAITPPTQAVLAGGSASLTVTTPANVSGFAFQWFENGTNLAGATAATLTISGATTGNDSADYTVVETLAGQSATSAPPAAVQVVPVSSSFYANEVLADGPAGYWRVDESNGATIAVDQSTFHNGYYSNYNGSELQQTGALIDDPDTASAFASGNFVGVPYSAELANTNAYSLEAWVNPSSTGSRADILASFGGLPNAGYELAIDASGNLDFRTSTNDNSASQSWNDLSGGPVTAGQWTHVVATYDGQTKRLYTNGVLAASAAEVNFRAAKGIDILVGAGGTIGAAVNLFNGSIDEPAIYRKTLSPSQVVDHYLAGTVAPGTAPTIVTQPQSVQVALGDTNTVSAFSVQASGSPSFSFQWFSNSVAIAGATNGSYSVTGAGAAATTAYAVQVANGAGTVTSANALLVDTVPVTPAAATAFPGGSASFSTGLPSYQTYVYQWQFAGANLPGATNTTLFLNNVSPASAGNYAAVATLGTVSVTSAPVVLAILTAPAQTYSNTIVADGPVSWWRLDDSPGSSAVADVFGVNNGYSFSANNDVTLGVAGALLGDADTAAEFTGYSSGNRADLAKLEVPYASALNGQTFSVELWALVTAGAGTTRSPLTSRAASTGVAQGYAFYAGDDDHWQLELGNGTSFLTVEGPSVAENHWAHLVATYDGTTAAFYVNGALAWSGAATYVPDASTVLRIGAGATESVTGSYYFPGRIDEVAVYANALTTAQVQAHYAAAFPADAAPGFTQPSTSRAALVGTSISLSTAVHDAQPVTLQWQQNGTNLAGATNATLTLSPVTAASAGVYQVTASSGTYAATNTAVNLAVLPGQAVSGHLQGYSAATIAGQGGIAGYVSAANWNEFAYASTAGSVSNLVDNNGENTGISAAWKATNDRQWGGPRPATGGDYALLGGFLDTTTAGSVTLTLGDIPASYQTAGYSLYLYFGEPSATLGLVNTYDTFGAVSVGTATNYYHSIDLSQWDGNYYQATNGNPTDSSPADANYAVFTNLTGASVTATVVPHPALGGPASLSGFQLVANVAGVSSLAISQSGSNLVLNWSSGVLQSKHALTDSWQDVSGATSPYTIPAPWSDQQYYRLRQ